MSVATPESVHPTHDRPTPENIDDWTDEQLSRFNELNARRLQREAAEQRADQLDDASAETAKQLIGAVTDADAPQTTTVDIAEGILDEPMEAGVLTYRPGKVETRFARISTIDDAVDALVFALTEMIQSPAELTNEAVWRHVYDEGGVRVLEAYLDNVMGPVNSVQSFRTE